MDCAVAVGHRQRLAQGVDGQHILGRTAAGTSRGIGVTDLPDQVVGIQAGSTRRGDAIDPFGYLLATAGKNQLHGGQADGIVGGFRGLVIGVGDGAIDIVFDRLGDIAQGIEITSGLDPPGINKLPGQPSRVVGGSGDQHRVGPAGDRGRPGVAGAPIGADIHHPSQTVGAIEVANGVADPGLHAGRSSAQRPGAGLIVEPLLGGDQNDMEVAMGVAIVGGLDLLQDWVTICYF